MGVDHPFSEARNKEIGALITNFCGDAGVGEIDYAQGTVNLIDE